MIVSCFDVLSSITLHSAKQINLVKKEYIESLIVLYYQKYSLPLDEKRLV